MKLLIFRRSTICRFVVVSVVIFLSSMYVNAQDGTSIIFLHHSCGSNLIHDGRVREGLSELGYRFFDHGYNDDGLCLADGHCPGSNFDVPGDNTDPDGIAQIFYQPLQTEPQNTFSYLMQYDVIMFKSCYPVSNIASDALLETYKSHYLSIRDRMDQYSDKLFVIVTQPPQVPGSSSSDEAQRARELADWLSSDIFLDAHPNVLTFNFFDSLAAEDNFLRKDYRINNRDAHPNSRANREIGPLFVSFIDAAIREYSPETQQHTVIPPTDAPVVEESSERQPATGTGNLPCSSVFLPLLFATLVNFTRTQKDTKKE